MSDLTKVRELIHSSNNIVVLSGIKIDREIGLLGVRAEEKAYEIETKFGYSPEEILTVKFLRNRVELFYQYYKEHLLQPEKMYPSPAHFAMAELERQGKVSAVITRSVYGLHGMAGIHNLCELHGNINSHTCPKCGNTYPVQYVLESKGVPVCEHCNLTLIPGMVLFGEALDNGKASWCSKKVEDASIIIMTGSARAAYLARLFLQYYKGDQLIIINDVQTSYDDRASYVLRGEGKDILPQLL